MQKLVLLDTNFLFGKRLDINFAKNFKEKDIDVFISQFVLDELKGQNIRDIKAVYDRIQNAINDTKYPELYFDIKDNTNLDLVFNESDLRMDKYFSKIFGSNIIPVSDKEESFDILLDRSKRKIPPFNDEKGASDKGFKDTLIWMNFISFCQKNNYDEYYLVTKDNGFIKHENAIKAEFKNKVGTDSFGILQFSTTKEIRSYFLKDEAITEKEITSDLPFEEEKTVKIVEIDRETIQKAKTSVNDLLYTIEYNNYNDYSVANFELYQKLNEEMIVKFCELLANKKLELIFFDSYDVSEILDELSIENKKYYKVDINNVINFIEVWEVIKKDFFNYTDAFITFLMTEFNDLVIEEQNLDPGDDIPF